MTAERRRLLTISEAAEFLGVHQNTLRTWADRGHVPHVRTPAGQRRFALADLEQVQQGMRDAAEEKVGKLAA